MAGKLIIISAPSGAGKTSIVRGVLEQIPQLTFSISACSRPMRASEKNGQDYYFLSVDEFRKKINEGAFLEWEEVYPGSFYGTLREEVERIWSSGKHVLFDVDVAGGLNLKKQFPQASLAVFIRPPSMEELRERLTNRDTETEESLQRRLGKAAYELTYAKDFDVVVINDILSRATEEAVNLINAFLRR